MKVRRGIKGDRVETEAEEERGREKGVIQGRKEGQG